MKAALTGSFSETDLIVLRQLKETLDLIEEQYHGPVRRYDLQQQQTRRSFAKMRF
nr:hypothetical protein [Tannerella forsythia]